MSPRPTPRPTPLRDFHVARGARLTDFAGWELPLQYKDGGFIAEHLAVREAAGFFDVSHMGQASVIGKDAAAALSRLLPADIDGMTPGQSKYTQLLNDNGGIVDDLIVGRETDGFFLVVNASRKEIDFDLMKKTFSQFADAQLRLLPDWALVAVQGPGAVAAVAAAFPAARELSFMESLWAAHQGAQCRISRSGLHRRGRIRDLRSCRNRARFGGGVVRAGVCAPLRVGRARFFAARGGFAALRIGFERGDDSGRSRAFVVDSQIAPRERRLRRRIRVARAHSNRSGEKTRRNRAARKNAGARRRGFARFQ